MTYFDREGMAYVENDELYMREISLMTLENNPDCVRDFDRPGYWVKIASETMVKLLDARCNMLTTHLQARRRYDSIMPERQPPQPQIKTRTRKR